MMDNSQEDRTKQGNIVPRNTTTPPVVNRAGLSSAAAADRLRADGFNEVVIRRPSGIVQFLSFLWGPIPWMIECACFLSFFEGQWSDMTILLALLLLNALVGFWQEHHSENAVSSLQQSLVHAARVRRDGQWTVLPSRELVTGDYIRVRIGDIAPADVMITNCEAMEVDESMLTGESLPVTRKSGDMLYAGSIVRRGEMDGIIQATGVRTKFGRVADLSTRALGMSHFQKEILSIGNFLLIIAGILAVLLLSVGIARGESFLTNMRFALILAVAAIPAAMPAILTTTMALGARLLARQHAVVTRLESIHELAGVDILCCDKTGTLTQNNLAVVRVLASSGYSDDDVLLNARLASRGEDHDPIDQAILAGKEIAPTSECRILHFTPFDPHIKRTEAIVQSSQAVFSVTKGSVPVILSLCSDADTLRAFAEKEEQHLADAGLRALGVARKEGDAPWRFVGILALCDPPREDARSLLRDAQLMGISIKMITGDQLPIAREMARQLSIQGDILDACMIEDTATHQHSGISDAEIERAGGFAKTFPDQKYAIVASLQRSGHIVGMTGDGVNDAPALHRADAGIAASGAVDAARNAADIVLLQPGLSTIIEALKESRRIFTRMTGYAMYRIAETIRVLLFITCSVIFFRFYPVTPTMIILLALLNDGAILSIAFDHAATGTTPQRWHMRNILSISTALGIAGVASSFLFFVLCEKLFMLPQDVIQTLLYLKLSIAGHMLIFITRTRDAFWRSTPALILLLTTGSTQIIATLLAVFGVFMTPIGWMPAVLVWLYALAWMPVQDILKRGVYRLLLAPSIAKSLSI